MKKHLKLFLPSGRRIGRFTPASCRKMASSEALSPGGDNSLFALTGRSVSGAVTVVSDSLVYMYMEMSSLLVVSMKLSPRDASEPLICPLGQTWRAKKAAYLGSSFCPKIIHFIFHCPVAFEGFPRENIPMEPWDVRIGVRGNEAARMMSFRRRPRRRI